MTKHSIENFNFNENELPYYARPFLKECVADIRNNLPEPSEAEIQKLAKTNNTSEFLQKYWDGGISCFTSISILIRNPESLEQFMKLMKKTDIDITANEDDLAKNLLREVEVIKTDFIALIKESIEGAIKIHANDTERQTNSINPAKIEDFTENNLVIAISILIMTAISQLKIAEENITYLDFREQSVNLNNHLQGVVFWHKLLIHLKRARENINPKVRKIIEGKRWKAESMKKKESQYREFIDWALSQGSSKSYRYPREALLDFVTEKEKTTRAYDYLKTTPRSCDTFIRKLKEHCQSEHIPHPFPPINK